MEGLKATVEEFKGHYEKNGRHDFLGQVPFLSSLAQHYSDKSENWLNLVKAHGLYNACGKREPNNPIWFEKAFQIEQRYINNFRYSKSMIHTVNHQQRVITLMQNLQNIRRDAKTLLIEAKLLVGNNEASRGKLDKPESTDLSKWATFCEKVQTISFTCRDQMISFVSDIMQYAVELAGDPPCGFAVVAMGSLARCEVTPYSDLEYFFLIENEEFRRFFENLAVVSYFIISDLRETNIKCFAVEELQGWFIDYSDSGFEVDGFSDLSGNVPTGRKPGLNSYIKTVNEMVDMYERVYLCLTNDEDSSVTETKANGAEKVPSVDHSRNLNFDHLTRNFDVIISSQSNVAKADFSAMISSTVFVYGNNSLHKEFEMKINQIKPNPERVRKSLLMLTEDIKKFDFLPDCSLENIKSVKRDIFRFPSIILYDLKINCVLQATTVWDVIKCLKNFHISESFAQSIFFIMCVAQYVRLDTYLLYNSQNDEMSVLPARNTEESFAFFPSVLFLQMCVHLVPLKKLISQMNLTLETFKQIVDLTELELCKALTCYHMNDYMNCVQHFESHFKSITDITDPDHLFIYIQALAHSGKSLQALRHMHNVKVASLLPDRTRAMLTGYIQYCMGMYEQALNSYSQVSVIDQQILLVVALIFKALGNYEKALAYCLAGIRQQPQNIIEFFQVKAEIVVCQGNYLEAQNIYMDCLEIAQKQFGKTTCHPLIASIYQDIGVLYITMGRLHEALGYYEEAFAMWKQLYGDDALHDDIATSHNNIGHLYHTKGMHEKALEHFKKALCIEKSIYGYQRCHPSIASSYSYIASLYHDTIRYGEALKYYKKTLIMLKSLYGDNACHPDIALAYSNLGTLYHDLDMYKEALEHYELSLNMQKSVYGADACHPGIAKAYNKIGAIFHQAGRHEEAFELYQKALKMRQSLYGNNGYHPDFIESYHNIGQLHKKIHKNDEALLHYNKALKTAENLYGKQACHPEIARIYSAKGNLYYQADRREEAIAHYKIQLSILKSCFGDNACHPEIEKSYNTLGILYRRIGKNAVGMKLLFRALEISKILHGDNACHASIETSYSNIGYHYQKIGKHEDAMVYYQKALKLQQILYGHKLFNSDVYATYAFMGISFQRTGRYKEALEFYHKAIKMIDKFKKNLMYEIFACKLTTETYGFA